MQRPVSPCQCFPFFARYLEGRTKDWSWEILAIQRHITTWPDRCDQISRSLFVLIECFVLADDPVSNVLMQPCTSFWQAFRSPFWKFQSAPDSRLSAVINHSLFVSADWTSSSSRIRFFCGLQQPRAWEVLQRWSWCPPVLKVVREPCWILCWCPRARSAGWWRMETRTVWSGQETAMCSSLFQFSFKVKAEILAYSKSFEAHHPGSAKITEHAHHEAKISLQRCRSATFFKSVWDLGPSDDQDVWKNQENCHSQFS